MTKIEVKEAIKKWGKLPKVFKAKWLNALRSGDYRKTESTLCAKEVTKKSKFAEEKYAFCVLGVAGHIQGVPKEDLIDESVLDESVTSRAKRVIPAILRPDSDVAQHLMEMNDKSKKVTFPKIADWIEENL